MITLRDSCSEDVAALVAVIRVSFAEYRGKLNPPSSAEMKTVEVVRAELESAEAIVAEVNGQIAGCVFFRLEEEESVYLDRLSVLPKYRGIGVGRRLMERVEIRARVKGAKSLTLSVRLSLAIQQEFYERLGFEFDAYGTHEGYEEPTFVKMRKVLK